MKTILHINSYFIGTKLHGVMLNHMERDNYINQVFVPTSRPNYNYSTEEGNVLISKCFTRKDRLNFLHKQRKIYKSLLTNINVNQIDLVHAYTVFADGVSALKLHEQFGKKYVVAVRDTDLNTFFKYFIYLRGLGIKVLENAEAVFFLSEPYREELISKYIPDEMKKSIQEKAYIIPNGIDDFWHLNEAYKNWVDERISNFNPTKIKILCTGRICHRKNIPTIQKAMKILNERGYYPKLQLIGPIDDEKLYKRLLRDSNTVYHEPVAKEDLIQFYRSNEIFVLPSFTETFGLVYAEAMSQGLPVLYSRGQGFDKQFPDGEVGFSVDAYSPESVADGIMSILENYKIISENTVEKSRVFSWDKICKRYYEIYQKILH